MNEFLKVPQVLSVPTRIITGTACKISENPWQVQLTIFKSTIEIYFCGGSILSSIYILTAGHCADVIPSSCKDCYIRVVYGTEKLVGYAERAENEAYVETIILHEGYKASSDRIENDIAVLKLYAVDAITLNTNPNFKAVTLPPLESRDVLPADTKVKVSGWGVTKKGGNLAPELQCVYLYTQDLSEW